jgi:hypothetical protein
MEAYIFCVASSDPVGELVGLWEKFVMYELHEIMRQKGDAAFAVALNHMADETDSVRCYPNSVKMHIQ